MAHAANSATIEERISPNAYEWLDMVITELRFVDVVEVSETRRLV